MSFQSQKCVSYSEDVFLSKRGKCLIYISIFWNCFNLKIWISKTVFKKILFPCFRPPPTTTSLKKVSYANFQIGTYLKCFHGLHAIVPTHHFLSIFSSFLSPHLHKMSLSPLLSAPSFSFFSLKDHISLNSRSRFPDICIRQTFYSLCRWVWKKKKKKIILEYVKKMKGKYKKEGKRIEKA